MDNKGENFDKLLYNKYISLHFGKLHKNLDKEYKKYFHYFEQNFGKYLPTNKDSKIIDLACGMGHFLYFLQKKGYTNFTGVDISAECVEVCKKNGLPILQDDIFNFLKNNKGISAIVANDVIEHLNSQEISEFLKLSFEALNENGVLILKVPNAANPITGCALLYLDYTHKMLFTELSLETILGFYFNDVIIVGQNIFCYYWNPLNYIGLVGQFLFDKIFKILSMLYGQFETNIFKKSLIAIARK